MRTRREPAHTAPASHGKRAVDPRVNPCRVATGERNRGGTTIDRTMGARVKASGLAAPDSGEPIPATVAWHLPAPEPWSPPAAAGVAWPNGLTVDAWPVVDPGPRAAGTWRSAGYRASSTCAAWLGRGLAVLTVTMAVAGVVVGTGGNLGLLGAGAATSLVPALQAVVVVVAIATFLAAIAWLHRLVGNVPPLTGRTPVLSPAQVAVLCCVPGFHLVVPLLTFEDLAIRVRLPGQEDVRRLVRAWAATAILAQVLAGGALLGRPSPLPATIAAGALLAGAVSTLLLLLIVRRIDDRASRLAVLLRLGGGGAASRWPAFPGSAATEPAAMVSSGTTAPRPGVRAPASARRTSPASRNRHPAKGRRR
jgi:Domain of unknown function (DUF4328)